MFGVRVFDESTLPDRLVDEWSQLAESLQKPLADPSWLLSVWRHTRRSKDTLLRIVCVLGGDGSLLALLPLSGDPSPLGYRYRLLGSGVATDCDLLVRRPATEPILEAAARGLAGLTPAPSVVLFEETDADSPYVGDLSRLWPGRGARLFTDYTQPVPHVVVEEGGFDEWFASKSRNFRSTIRRQTRKLEDIGATFHTVSDPHDWVEEIGNFADLHRSNWAARGGSGVVTEGVPEALVSAATDLGPRGKLFLHKIVVDGASIASSIFFASGQNHIYWLGGYDERFSQFKPGFLAVFAGIRHAIEAGGQVISLGIGGQDYKYRFANETQFANWYSLVPASPIAQLQRLPHAKAAAKLKLISTLPPSIRNRLKSAVRAVRHSTTSVRS